MLLRTLVLLVLASSSVSFGWGFDGHRRLASLMQDALPQGHCLRAWFAARQTSALQDKACDPDRWRASDPAEAPRHYLQIDWVMPPSNYPRDYSAVVALLGARNASNNGIVPWHVEVKYGQLVAAFRARNPTAILDQAFVLSHYVFDSFSVLHDTKNFDPNNGLHARWESDMLNTMSNLNGITTQAATYYGTAGLADPRNNLFDVVLAGNPVVAQLIAADTAAAGSIPSLYSSTRELTARRWADGITVMSSLLWTAWAEAGRPELTGFSTSCSRSAPMVEIVLRGFPPPGGFTHTPDGGSPDAGMDADAGVDAGTGGGVGATGGGGGDSALGGGGGDGDPVGCSCDVFPPDAVLVLFGLLAFARRWPISTNDPLR